MPLASGTRFGPYDVLAPLGAGGMGEVYRARDTQLKRDVALKVLPAAVATDPERLARFQREAEVLAALNHPHIAQIYGVADADGVRALVMELVEGPTLAERIAQGALPVAEALPVACQLADALDEAHERGIVHRDLKPANIKLTPAGAAKVLDFGLAKAFGAEADADPATRSTMTSPAQTQAGIILGTAEYMSPEQARGRPVDKRADIWAFGVVLYEMLSGAKAFPGETITDVLGAIVKTEPDWTALPADTPPLVRRLLSRCLTKDPGQRMRDIGDVRFELAEAGPGGDASTAASRRPVPGPAGGPLLWAAVLTAVAAVAVLMWRETTRPDSDGGQVIQFSIPDAGGPMLALEQSLGQAAAFDISRDGRVVFPGTDGQVARLYIRAMSDVAAAPLIGTEGATAGFFSPDGRTVAFFADGKIKSIPTSGGSATTVADNVGRPAGGTWTDDDQIVFGADFSGLRIVPASGGTPQPLTSPDLARGEVGHIWPNALPAGRGILFSVFTEDRRYLAVYSRAEGTWTRLLPAGGEVRYLPTGHLLYQDALNLLVVPFDLETLTVNGTPAPVISGPWTTRFGGEEKAAFAVSSRGTLVVAIGGETRGADRLVWMSRRGEPSDLPCPPAEYGYPRISPDGTEVALNAVRLESADDRAPIVVVDRACRSRRLSRSSLNYAPVWAPDGGRVAFTSYRDGFVNLFAVSASGDGEPIPLVTNRDVRKYPASWTDDGQTLIYNAIGPGGYDIMSVDASGKSQVVVGTPKNERMARLSPNGRWLAYVSDESGREEVIVRSFPGTGFVKPVSVGGGSEPVWSSDGQELFYIAREGQMMAIRMPGGAAERAGIPVALFQVPPEYRHVSGTVAAQYDVHPDGRFLMIRRSDRTPRPLELRVTANWFEALRPAVAPRVP